MAFRTPQVFSPKEILQAFLLVSKDINRVEGHIESQQLALEIPLWSFMEADGTALTTFSDGASPTPGFYHSGGVPYGIRWNNHATPDPIASSVVIPPGLSAEEEIVISVLASKTGSTPGDAVTWDVTAYFIADGNMLDAIVDVGGTSAAMQGAATTSRIQEVSLTIDSLYVSGAPAVLALTLQPTDGTLGTDDVILHGVWIEYAGRFLEPVDLTEAPAYVYGYVFGGDINTSWLNDTEEFQPRTSVWAAKTDVTFSTTHDTNVVDGKGYSLGGYASGSRNNRNLQYDPADDSWATKAAMSETKYFLSTCGIASLGYAFGGFTTTCLTTAEQYTLAGDSWAGRTALATARSNAPASAIGLFGYVFCGKTNAVNATQTVKQFSHDGNSWADKTSITQQRRNLAASCATATSAYMVGGFQNETSALNEILRYDPDGSGTWTALVPRATAAKSLGAFAIDQEVFACGGYESTYVTTVDRYSITTDSWSVETPMAVSRQNFGYGSI